VHNRLLEKFEKILSSVEHAPRRKSHPSGLPRKASMPGKSAGIFLKRASHAFQIIASSINE
jgi:hypothetical protein